MNKLTRLLLALIVIGYTRLAAQTIEVGGVYPDFAATDHATGNPVKLSDLSGKIIVLDFFAYWCGPCQASSPVVETEIQKYYAQRGGNPHGIPVQVVGMNLESRNVSLTDQFISNAGMTFVWDDFYHNGFRGMGSNGIPTFAIISGVKNAEGIQQWQMLYKIIGYSSTFTTDMRRIIDAVVPITPPLFTAPAPLISLAEGTNLDTTLSVSGTAPISFKWFKDGVELPGATTATLGLRNASLADEGFYLCKATNAAGSAFSTVTQVKVSGSALRSELVNLSANTNCDAEGLVTPGFVIGGTTGTLRTLVRAVGPGLSGFGVNSFILDPKLTLFNQKTGVILSSNDNWGNTLALQAAFDSTKAFQLSASSQDAAMVVDLSPGLYTAEAARANCIYGGTVLVEVYKVAASGDTTFVNLSTLKNCGPAEVLTPGFVIEGTASKRVLLRAICDGLKSFGVSNTMPDCRLTLFNQKTGAQLAVNNDWNSSEEMTLTLKASFAETGAFELVEGSKDAVLLATLPPGSYTVEASSATPLGQGNIIVEMYEIK